jgi:hypothetical protein
MAVPSKPFVVTRKKCIASKPRRIERLASGYAVQEFRDDSQGCYWYVVTALEVHSRSLEDGKRRAPGHLSG